MTRRAFTRIKAGLDDARAFLDGSADRRRYRVHARRLPPLHPGEVLAEEFLKPHGISQRRFAREVALTPARVNALVHGRSAITAPIALRLAKYFGTTPELWMNLQASYELRTARAADWPKVEKRVRVLAEE